MRSGEEFPAFTPEMDESGRSLESRLGVLSDEEAALVAERVEALDPHDPDYLLKKIETITRTLQDIEEARGTEGENNE